MKKIYNLLDKMTSIVTVVMSLFTVVLLFFIVLQIFKEGWDVFKEISILNFITQNQWRPLSTPPKLGIKNMLLGTILTSFLGIVISLPISLGASIFISMKAKGKLRVFILALIDLMIGVPSVVYGFVSFMILVLFFERYFNFGSGESFFVAGVTLAIMVMPLMISAITQSMDKVITKYQTSAKALGVSKEFMTLNLLIPASKRGIIIATLLAFTRAMGETMAVVMVIGNSNLKPMLFGRGITLSGLITLEMGSAVLNSIHYKGLYATGVVLMILLLINNMIFEAIKKRVNGYD